MLRAPVSISHTAYEVLWEREDLGVMPSPIAISYPLRSLDNGARLARQAFDELQRAGLARGTEPLPELRAVLRALARGEQRFFGFIPREDGSEGGAVVAVTGDNAVLALRHADRLTLQPVPADRPAQALVRLLPAAPPGNGRSVNVRAADVDGARSGNGDGGVLVGVGAAGTEVDRLRRVLDRPIGFRCYLYASVGRQRCEKPLVVLDPEGDGRWFTTAQRDRSGQEWIIAVPATFDTIVSKLYEMRDRLT